MEIKWNVRPILEWVKQIEFLNNWCGFFEIEQRRHWVWTVVLVMYPLNYVQQNIWCDKLKTLYPFIDFGQKLETKYYNVRIFVSSSQFTSSLTLVKPSSLNAWRSWSLSMISSLILLFIPINWWSYYTTFWREVQSSRM